MHLAPAMASFRPSACMIVLTAWLAGACGRSELQGPTQRTDGGRDAPQTPGDGAAEVAAEERGAPDGSPAAGCPEPYAGRVPGPRPACPPGTYPQVVPGGCELCAWCQDSCCPFYSGACLPCAGECLSDRDCVLANRFGCLDESCRNVQSCAWAAPASDLARDPCLYDVRSATTPPPPAGCPARCSLPGTSPLCKACAHCAPDGVSCAAGRCVATWRGCARLEACD